MPGRFVGLCSCCGNRGCVGASLHSTQIVNLYNLGGQVLLLPHAQTATLGDLYAVIGAHVKLLGGTSTLDLAKGWL